MFEQSISRNVIFDLLKFAFKKIIVDKSDFFLIKFTKFLHFVIKV